MPGPADRTRKPLASQEYPTPGSGASSLDAAPKPPRTVIINFMSCRIKSNVMELRKKLKNLYDEIYPWPIFFQDDLTARRAKMAYQAHQLKNSKKSQTPGLQIPKF